MHLDSEAEEGDDGSYEGDGGYVVESTAQSYVFCPLSSILSARGSTPDSNGTHLDVEFK